MNTRSILSLALLLGAFGLVAEASTYTVTCSSTTCTSGGTYGGGMSSSSLAASAVFTYTAGTLTTPGTLTVKLENDGLLPGAGQNYEQGDVLTGVFFGNTGGTGVFLSQFNTTATGTSAVANSLVSNTGAAASTSSITGTTVDQTVDGCIGGGHGANADIGCQWAFGNSTGGVTGYGTMLATSGYSLGGSAPGSGTFANDPASNTNYGATCNKGTCKTNTNLDGLDNGIGISPNSTTTYNESGQKDVGFVKYYATFTLSGNAFAPGADGDLGALIGNVRFQYGTGIGEYNLSCAFGGSCEVDVNPLGVPEPGFYGALSLGMSGLFWVAFRRRNKNQA